MTIGWIRKVHDALTSRHTIYICTRGYPCTDWMSNRGSRGNATIQFIECVIIPTIKNAVFTNFLNTCIVKIGQKRVFVSNILTKVKVEWLIVLGVLLFGQISRQFFMECPDFDLKNSGMYEYLSIKKLVHYINQW